MINTLFVFVQNFENNYIEFDKPIIKVNNLAYKRNDNNDSKSNIEISVNNVISSFLELVFL
jgi:hypothetical protein